MQAGVAEADAVILRMPLQSLAAADADAQVAILPHLSGLLATAFLLDVAA